MRVDHRLNPIFDFSSVAVVGASDSGGTGGRVYGALQRLGYDGVYYPINARTDRVQGMQAYPNVSSLPDTPEMVVIAVPRDAVPSVIDECAVRGVKASVILAAGFVERDEHGAKLQKQISATARESGLLVVGPNCLGIVSVVNKCCGFSGAPPTRSGNVAIISHSGGLMNEVMWSGGARGVAFSHVASVGNEAGVTSADLIDYFVADPATDVILAIIESVRDPQGFVASCSKALDAAKPLVVLKMGLSVKAAHSAATHTGALAGSPAVHEALFRQKGVIQVHDLDELVDMAALFSHAVAPLRARRMERAAIIEISGGGAGLICDTAVAAGVELPELSPEGAEKLQAQLTGIFATNPIDTGGSWGDANKKDIYPACLEAFASEPGIDIVVSRYTIPQSGELGALQDRLRELELARAAHPDRFFPILSRTSVQFSPTWLDAVVEQRLAFLQGYGRGLRALGCLVKYSRAVHGGGATQAAGSHAQPTEAKAAAPALRVLGEVDSKALLAAAGIPTIETVHAITADEAVREANRIGYPVVLKVSAVEITHKSDQGGVLLNLTDAEAVKRGFESLQEVASKASATFQGVTVQPMAKTGVEVIIGGHQDQQFGPVIAFGLGGIFVEVLRDVALRVAPLSAEDASAMLEEVKGKALLDGLRGQPPCDRGAITDALCRLSELMLARPDITSIDANPAFVYPSGLTVADARIILT